MKFADKRGQLNFEAVMEAKRRNSLFPALIAAALFLLIGVLGIMSMSFAWLNVSRVPFISGMDVSVITENNLLIAPDVDGMPGEWDRYLDASQYMENYAPLKPVTYTDNYFYKLIYDDESKRSSGLSEITDENINVAVPENGTAAEFKEYYDKGYVVNLDYWIKTQGATAAVSLAKPHENEEGGMTNGTYAVGKPVWSSDDVAHINGAYGAETTLRIGFQIWEADSEGNLVNPNSSTFFIYEPNADIHPVDGKTGYTATQNADGTGLLTDDAHMIIQNASTWSDTDPALADVVVYSVGDFIQNRQLFSLNGANMVKIRMWMWMEGQDDDCGALTLATEKATEILVNIDFGVEESAYESEIERRSPGRNTAE